jgi:hypothetical protein
VKGTASNCHSFAHTQQPKAIAMAGTRLGRMRVKPNAIITDAKLQRTIMHTYIDPDVLRLCMPHHIR